MTLELQPVGESGTVYRIDRGDMAPYGVLFAQGRLSFLAKQKMLSGAEGASWNARVSAITEARSPADLAVTIYQDDDALVFALFVQERFHLVPVASSEGCPWIPRRSPPTWVRTPPAVSSSVR